MSTPAVIPPLPQANPIAEKDGRLTLVWNMFFVELLRYIQANTNSIAAIEFGGGGGNSTPGPAGGVAGAGSAGAAALTTGPSSEGTLNLGSRADHTHQMAIQAEQSGTDLGTVQAVNVQTPYLDAFVEPNLTGSLLTDLWGYWPLDETTGLRSRAIGTGPDLAEVGGAVASAAGKFGRAITSAKTDTTYLQGTAAPISPATGFSLGIWFWLDDNPQALTTALVMMTKAAAFDWLYLERLGSADTLQFGVRSPGNVITNGPVVGPFTRNAWHSALCWYDASLLSIGMQVDAGPVYLTPVDMSAWSLDTLTVGQLGGGSRNWHGRGDALMIWTRTLTASERALVLTSVRVSLAVNPFALETFGGM